MLLSVLYNAETESIYCIYLVFCRLAVCCGSVFKNESSDLILVDIREFKPCRLHCSGSAAHLAAAVREAELQRIAKCSPASSLSAEDSDAASVPDHGPHSVDRGLEIPGTTSKLDENHILSWWDLRNQDYSPHSSGHNLRAVDRNPEILEVVRGLAENSVVIQSDPENLYCNPHNPDFRPHISESTVGLDNIDCTISCALPQTTKHKEDEDVDPSSAMGEQSDDNLEDSCSVLQTDESMEESSPIRNADQGVESTAGTGRSILCDILWKNRQRFRKSSKLANPAGFEWLEIPPRPVWPPSCALSKPSPVKVAP